MKAIKSTRFYSLLTVLFSLTSAAEHMRLNRVSLFDAAQASTMQNQYTKNQMYANNPISSPFQNVDIRTTDGWYHQSPNSCSLTDSQSSAKAYW